MQTSSQEPGRRGFLGWLLGISGVALLASAVYPIVRFISPPRIPEATASQVEAGPTNDPEFVEKGYKIVRFGVEPVIVIRLTESEFRAFAATCTHLDCIVEYHKDKNRIWCNCHNGEYDLSGGVVAGPPPKPLPPFKAEVVSKGSGQPGAVVITKA
jgi:Rieske Fe-S protein